MADDDKQSPAARRADGTHDRATRTRLPIPIRAKIGRTQSHESRLHDVSATGFRIDWSDEAEVGQMAIVRFDGYPSVCPAFVLMGRVVRIVTGKEPGLGIAIDLTGSTKPALEHFHRLVGHYREHRPLLDEMPRDFFEGRCAECDWVGRVGERSPVCPRCGGRVGVLDPDQ
jgi:hypothetical protein